MTAFSGMADGGHATKVNHFRNGLTPMFIDTNVLVQSRVLGAPGHDAARASLERAFRNPEPLRISRQIMREYLAVVTRPQT